MTGLSGCCVIVLNQPLLLRLLHLSKKFHLRVRQSHTIVLVPLTGTRLLVPTACFHRLQHSCKPWPRVCYRLCGWNRLLGRVGAFGWPRAGVMGHDGMVARVCQRGCGSRFCDISHDFFVLLTFSSLGCPGQLRYQPQSLGIYLRQQLGRFLPT